jgi:hypothetical protein
MLRMTASESVLPPDRIVMSAWMQCHPSAATYAGRYMQ